MNKQQHKQALIERYGMKHIPLDLIAKDYMGMDADTARKNINRFPFNVYRAGSTKSPWMVNADEFGAYLEKRENLGV